MNKTIVTSVVMGALLFAPMAFAGNPGQGGQTGQTGQTDQVGQSDQSGQAGQVGQGQHQGGCHGGFFKNIKKAFCKGFQAGKKTGTKVFDAVQNKVADTGVAVKKAVTGCKPKTFVKGHYDKNGNHTKGHYRKVGCGHHGKGK